MRTFVVAVDGPAGSGKSSVCRLAAQRLGFDYLDTGAGYRAFAIHWLESGRPNPETILESFDYEISTQSGDQKVTLGGRDITAQIRLDSTSAVVSEIAGNAAVRNLQRADAIARVSASSAPGVVVEGRDITTVVFPGAPLRLILTASPEARQRRRSLDVVDAEVSKTVLERDAKDLLVVDFMSPAPGVEVLDTTDLDLEKSVDALVELIESCREDV